MPVPPDEPTPPVTQRVVQAVTPPQMPALTQALAQHLAQEIRLMQDFIALLDEEARVLENPAATQALHATTRRKHGYADQLQAAAVARTAHLAALGFADVREDLSPVVQQYPDLRPAIDTLIALAARARDKNAENGIAIQTYQRHHREALAALRTLRGCGENRLYDARGRSQRAGTGSIKTHVAAG